MIEISETMNQTEERNKQWFNQVWDRGDVIKPESWATWKIDKSASFFRFKNKLFKNRKSKEFFHLPRFFC